MIKKSEPLSMSESISYIEKEDPLNGFIKKFIKLDPKKVDELRKKN